MSEGAKDDTLEAASHAGLRTSDLIHCEHGFVSLLSPSNQDSHCLNVLVYCSVNIGPLLNNSSTTDVVSNKCTDKLLEFSASNYHRLMPNVKKPIQRSRIDQNYDLVFKKSHLDHSDRPAEVLCCLMVGLQFGIKSALAGGSHAINLRTEMMIGRERLMSIDRKKR